MVQAAPVMSDRHREMTVNSVHLVISVMVDGKDEQSYSIPFDERKSALLPSSTLRMEFRSAVAEQGKLFRKMLFSHQFHFFVVGICCLCCTMAAFLCYGLCRRHARLPFA